MVVCRLRKNIEFNLDENPRKGSAGQRHSSTLANDVAALSVVEQNGGKAGTLVADSCSKEGSSSYNSHSVEQNDSWFDSVDKTTNEISPHGSSSCRQFQVLSFSLQLSCLLLIACLMHFQEEKPCMVEF